tara:strand:+ start:442 stop:882 length:441 start_codon:yes stop_codon:yes gene_type:complete
MDIIKKIILFFIVYNIIIYKTHAEPIVVMEYSTDSSKQDNDQNSSDFIKNEDYSSNYRIKKNESLSNILDKFYGGKGLNIKIVQTAVVLKNKHAFVRNNPNFMYANKKLYLPSIKEIKNLVYKESSKSNNVESKDTNVKDIYFFGN